MTIFVYLYGNKFSITLVSDLHHDILIVNGMYLSLQWSFQVVKGWYQRLFQLDLIHLTPCLQLYNSCKITFSVPSCPKGWVRLESRCFYVVKQHREFDDAEVRINRNT